MFLLRSLVRFVFGLVRFVFGSAFRLLRRFAVPAAIGAAAAYFFDPERGRGRRASLRDQAQAKARRSATEAEKRARFAQGRLEGARVRSQGGGVMHPEDDRDVVQGIRMRLSTLGIDTSKVVIDVVDGVAALRGQLGTPEDIRAVRAAVASVPGVAEVESYLHLPNTPAPNKAASMSTP